MNDKSLFWKKMKETIFISKQTKHERTDKSRVFRKIQDSDAVSCYILHVAF